MLIRACASLLVAMVLASCGDESGGLPDLTPTPSPAPLSSPSPTPEPPTPTPTPSPTPSPTPTATPTPTPSPTPVPLVEFSGWPTVCDGNLTFKGELAGVALFANASTYKPEASRSYLGWLYPLPFVVYRGEQRSPVLTILEPGLDASPGSRGVEPSKYHVFFGTFDVVIAWPDDFEHDEDYRLGVWGLMKKFGELLSLRVADIEFC